MSIVREYTPKDLSAVFNINKTCHKKPQPNIALLEQIHRGQTWVAVDNDKVIGFLLSIYREGPYIYNVAVLPTYRKQGIATDLLKVCHEYYKEFGFIYLYVDTTNPAQKLYFDLGYRVQELKKNFYDKGQHALVMVKSF
jgi:ribosomal-protein-alanine N-acetyltransferase